MQVKIGDFGLACLDVLDEAANASYLKPDSPTLPRMNSSASYRDIEHTRGVGTTLYASPEQLVLNHYDSKVDII